MAELKNKARVLVKYNATLEKNVGKLGTVTNVIGPEGWDLSFYDILFDDGTTATIPGCDLVPLTKTTDKVAKDINNGCHEYLVGDTVRIMTGQWRGVEGTVRRIADGKFKVLEIATIGKVKGTLNVPVDWVKPSELYKE